MSIRIRKDATPVGNATSEQTGRAAEEAARRAGEEAARRVLEELARLTAQAASASKKSDTFKTAQPQTRGPELASDGVVAQGSTLLSENTRDGSVNCLDAVGDFLALAPAAIRARSDVLFLADSRPGAEAYVAARPPA